MNCLKMRLENKSTTSRLLWMDLIMVKPGIEKRDEFRENVLQLADD